MGMLDRYRKSGGYLQLLTLIETSPMSKQEKFLSLIKEESPAWEAELSKRRLSFKRILTWENQAIGEIVPRVPEKILGTALWPLSAEEKAKFMALVSPSQKRKLDEVLAMNPPSDGEIVTCQIKVIQEVREMFQSGHLRYEKVDPELIIPENIEEGLNKGSVSIVSMTSMATDAQVANLMEATTKESTSTTGAPSPAAVMLVEEMKDLRKKLQSSLNEVQNLQRENQTLKDKLEQIKKIA